MWKLVIEDDEGKRTVVPLTRDDYTIGRQEGNTIRLTERNVSRTHGRVRRSRNGSSKDVFVLEDLRSYNGVFVNGLRVAHSQHLQHGDLVQIGDYRIVLQDDAVSAIETAAMPLAQQSDDAKSTMPLSQAYRGQTLTDRPNRLVMLVGPTPGVEFPLDRERMTVGRAEDASISVNHNSVSRLHCEIHALGDGRFEIVDKGSSNGVRVNAAELKRSIIEAGDIIELGDVRFKFVGAGQVFVPGPNESQQLTAISDRDAELADPKRGGLGGYAGPIIGAGIVGAALIVAVVYVMRQRAEVPQNAPIGPSVDTEQAIIVEAKKSCTVEDCEASHAAITTRIAENSPWRDSADFHQIEQTWAESILRKAQAEPDPHTKRALLARIVASPKVDATQRKQANDMIAQIVDQPAPTPSELPVASASKDAGVLVAVVQPPPPNPRPPTTSHTTVTNATTSPAPTPVPAPAPKPTVNVDEKAKEAAMNGNPQEVKRLLEQRVKSGHATLDQARLLRAACKQLGDFQCADEVKAKYPGVAPGN